MAEVSSADKPKSSPIKIVEFPCTFQGGTVQSIKFYIGMPMDGLGPLDCQAKWLSSKGGTIPKETTDYLVKITEIAKDNNQSVGEVLEYAVHVNDENKRIESPAEELMKKINESNS